jgi:hypothetical protein
MFWNLIQQFFAPFTDSAIFSVSFHYLFVTAPIWLPIILFFTFFDVWMMYVRSQNIKETGSILLEIKLPKEITKSPAAMEIFLTSLQQSGSANYYEVLVEGVTRAWFSLELVSLEGQIHFYIWTRPKFKNLIEAQIYAQYPTVEIYQVEQDYTALVKHNPDKYIMWGTYLKLKKPDAYPIKTYVDYGMDKDPKEEFKIDPMTSVLEYLGSMGKGEQVWIQILIQAHRKNNFMNDAVFFEKEDWKKDIQKEIDKIKEEAKTEVGKGEYAMEVTHLTKGQMETIYALERSSGKHPFETMIRGFYIAEKEVFNSIGITGLIGSMRQYSSKDLNEFGLGWYTDHSDEMKAVIGFLPFPPFVKYMQRWRWKLERQMLEAYKRRAFFQYPFRHFRIAKPFILNTEELATIFHFPGQVATTPTIEKTMSKKAEAPPNLPI